MSAIPDTQTQQIHRAKLRHSYQHHPDNETLRKALLKSLRPKFIQQAAKDGVFICYSMTDGVFALDLALALRDAGIHVFLDELAAVDDTDWGDIVTQAMRDNAVLVMVLSPDGAADAEVRGEYTYFMRTGKIIIPVIAAECQPEGLVSLIEPINFVDDYDAALKQLKSLLTSNKKAST